MYLEKCTPVLQSFAYNFLNEKKYVPGAYPEINIRNLFSR